MAVFKIKQSRLSPAVSARLSLGLPANPDAEEIETEADAPEVGTEAASEEVEVEAEGEVLETGAADTEAGEVIEPGAHDPVAAEERVEDDRALQYMTKRADSLQEEVVNLKVELAQARKDLEEARGAAALSQAQVEGLSDVCRGAVERMSAAVGKEVVGLDTLKPAELISAYEGLNERLEAMYPGHRVSRKVEAEEAPPPSTARTGISVSSITKLHRGN